MENKDLIIIALIVATIYLYYQNRKLKGLSTTTENSETVFELDEDLIADKDEAIRKKNEAEAEVLDLGNKLKLKNQEVTRKDQEIERLKDEKSKVEIALNAKLKELKDKYSKQGKLLDNEQLENNKLTEKITELETKITELETERTNLLDELSKDADLDEFENWLQEDPSRQANLPEWKKILAEVKQKKKDYHLSENNWASSLFNRNSKYWQVFKNWVDNNHD